MPTFHQFLKILGLSSVVFLTACGGESDSSDSGSDSSSGGGSSTESGGFASSDVSGKTFFAIASDKSVMTFDYDTSKMSGGPGYVTSGSYDYYSSSWTLDNGYLVLADDDTKYKLESSETDYLSVCESDADSTPSCSSSELTRWYTDKAKAKTYATSDSAGTAIDFSTITDSKLKSHLQGLEYDNLEQVKIIYANDMEIASMAGLNQFTNLRKIYMAGNALTDISPIQTLTSLDALRIPGQQDSNGDLNLSSYAPITSLTSLRQLELTQFGSTTPTKFELDTYISNHTNKSSIRYLILRGLELDQDDINAIDGMNSLQRLAIEETGATLNFDTLASSNSLSNVRRLELGFNEKDSENSTFTFNTFNTADDIDFSKLQRLSLSNTNLTDSDLLAIGNAIGNSANLKRLDIRYIHSSATDTDFGESFKVPNLEYLKLRVSGADYDLDVPTSGGAFTPSKLKQLYLEDGDINGFTTSHYTNLERLRARASIFSDFTDMAGLATSLNALTKLTQLRVKGAKVGSASGTAITCSALTNAGFSKTNVCNDTD